MVPVIIKQLELIFILTKKWCSEIFFEYFLIFNGDNGTLRFSLNTASITNFNFLMTYGLIEAKENVNYISMSHSSI